MANLTPFPMHLHYFYFLRFLLLGQLVSFHLLMHMFKRVALIQFDTAPLMFKLKLLKIPPMKNNRKTNSYRTRHTYLHQSGRLSGHHA